MKRAVKMRQTSTASNSREGGESRGRQVVEVAVVAVDAEAVRLDDTQLASNRSRVGSNAASVATDVLEVTSNIQCLYTHRNNMSYHHTSQLTQQLSVNSSRMWPCLSSPLSSSNCLNTTDMDLRHLPVANAAKSKVESSETTHNQLNSRAGGKGDADSRNTPWPTRKFSLLQMVRNSLAPSSSRSRMRRAVRSHCPSGVETDRRRNARIVRSVRKSGSHSAHQVSL
mgnify:FL=1